MTENKLKIVQFVIEGLSREHGLIFSQEEIERVTRGLFNKNEINGFIEKLRDRGKIEIPKTGYVKVEDFCLDHL